MRASSARVGLEPTTSGPGRWSRPNKKSQPVCARNLLQEAATDGKWLRGLDLNDLRPRPMESAE